MRDRSLFVLLLGLAITGACPILVRLSEVDPIASAFWRMALSAPIVTLAWQGQKRRGGGLIPLSARDRWLLIAGGLFFAADLAVWHWAITLTRMVNAMLLGALSPVFVVIAGWLILRQRVKGLFLLGMAVALGGTALLSAQGLEFGGNTLLGDGLALAAAAFYAGYFLVVGSLRGRFAALQITCWGAWAAALVLLPLALLEDRFWPQTPSAWLVLVALAGFGQLGQTLIAQALSVLPPSMGSLLGQAQPLWTSGLAWILLGEAMTPLQFLAGAIVLVGVVIARRGSGAPG